MKTTKFLVVTSALVAILASVGVRGATPSEGTITAPTDNKLGERAKLTYEGAPVVGAIVFQETAAAPLCADLPVSPPGQCDEFTLHLAMPADWYAKRLGKVTARLEVTIDWSDAPGAESQDIDLLIFDSGGNQVGSGETDNIASGVPHENAAVARPLGGDYRIITAGIIGSVPSYTGIVRFILEPDAPINTIATKEIKFGAASVVSPIVLGGEPLVIADHTQSDTWWIDWPIGTRSQTGVLYRSTDDGASWRQVINARCPERRQPGCLTGGGGDTVTAISKGGVVYWANQEGLANEAVNVSTDHGITWPADRENAITNLDGTADRQWLATHGDQTAWISATAVGLGVGVARTDDGGMTWQTLAPLDAEVTGSSAPMVADDTGGPNDGTLYILTDANGLSIHVSRDKGATFTTYPNTDAPNSGPAAGTLPSPILIPWLAIDRAGNLYVAWSDTADGAVHMTTMKASDPRNKGDKLGSTWSKPVRVSIPPANSTVFSQIVAGDPGRVAVTYQGADIEEAPSEAPAGTPWSVYAAFSTDALCQWDGSCSRGPAFAQTRVTERINHVGQICVSGIGCTADPEADRSLLDFFDLAVDTDGRVGVTWTDDHFGILNSATTDRTGYIMFAKILNGPSLRSGKAAFGTASFGAVPGASVARAGNAVWPINEPGGRNFSTLDLLGGSVSLGLTDMKFQMKLASTENLADGLAAGIGTTHVKYLTRWAFKDDIYFVAADTTGDEPRFYGGRVDAGDEMLRTAVTTVYGTTYTPEFDVEGSVSNGSIQFSVPLNKIGNPRVGDRFYSVQSFTIVGPDDALQTIYTSAEAIDATPSVDYVVGAKVLGARVARTTKPAAKPKPKGGQLPATGVGGESTGVVLLSAAALAWVLRGRRVVLDR